MLNAGSSMPLQKEGMNKKKSIGQVLMQAKDEPKGKPKPKAKRSLAAAMNPFKG